MTSTLLPDACPCGGDGARGRRRDGATRRWRRGGERAGKPPGRGLLSVVGRDDVIRRGAILVIRQAAR
jgi:hypothetical protein